MKTGEHFMWFILPKEEVETLVSEMRKQGLKVEETGLGYICHEETPFGTALVMSALRGKDRYRVKANFDYFERPRNLN